MKKNRKRFAFLCAVLLVATVLVQPLSAFADTPYHTFTRDSWGDLVLTQSAYAPWKVIGKELYLDNPEEKESPRFSPLSNPSDLFVTENDEIYVADTGNNRVVQMDIDGRLVRILEVKEKPLNKPQGVFVTPAGQIYIADTGNNRVVLLDAAGRYVREFGRPDSKFIPDMYKFDPTKLVVDKRGFLYIVTLGGYQGMLQLDPQGTFQGFFGTNQAQLSFADRLKKLFYTKEMYARELSKLPGSINSAAIDKDGFIYTVSSGENITQHQLKKLNFAGENLINKADEYAINHRGSEELSFGEMRGRDSVQQRPPKLIDVAVSPNGNMTVIDGEHQYISQYDAYGNLLFFWSGSSMASALQTGLPKSPVAIESLSDNTLLIADSQEGIVHLYKPTEFGNLIFEANQLTLEGKYEESESLWQEALRFHANFPNAQLGLAKAAFKRGDMKLAQSLFREAGIQKGYSDAFWRIRLASFQHNFSWIATILLAAGIAFVLLDRYARRISLLQRLRYRKKREFALVAQLRHALYILKHPVDGFTAIRFENKGSYRSALIILLLVYAAVCIEAIFTSFTFNKNEVFTANISAIFLQTFTIWILWVISNYLIGAIYRGEARFRDVFIGSAYCLVPFVLVGIPLAFLSNGMTGSESSIYEFMYRGMQVWTVALFFWKVHSLQNYSVGETIINILCTVFTMIVISVLVFITFGLTSDLMDFVNSIYQEVRLR